MVGTSRKLGRGGGGRGIHAPPIKRPSSATKPSVRRSSDSDRRGLGGASSSAAVASSTEVEERFSLVRENHPLSFAMAIKLTPDLVEEIKRVEAHGSVARIKFNANPVSANGNVISVGDKNFKFTWSTETPVLCDIYEERQTGEDGNGLLVESGSAWRKLSVQRVLDESTQNHVKMRSEEADRKLKSRRAIVLDPQNSSMNQMKALAAAESNQKRNLKNRKEPPSRKPKPGTTTAVGPHKPTYRLGLSMTTPSKGKPLSGSPLSSQPQQHGASASPFTSGNLVKGHASGPDVATIHNLNKISVSDKETNTRLRSSTHGDNSKNLCDTKTKSSDLRSLKRAPSESSSRQISLHKSPASQKIDQLLAQDTTLSMRADANDEEQAQLRSTPGHAFNTVDKIDVLHNSPDHRTDKKASDNGERLQDSSSESDSDSDSDSTSESDASSSSKKQASDEDVDIMSSDNNKESNGKLRDSDPFSTKSPVQLRHPYSEFVTIRDCEKHDDHVADVVDIDKDSLVDNHETARSAANYLFPNQESREPVEEIKHYSAGHHENREKSSKGKSKRPSDDKHFDEGPHNHNSKRLKGNNSREFVSGTVNLLFGESTNTSSPDEPLEQPNIGPTDQIACKINRVPLQKKGVESHNEDGLPIERSLTIFSSEGVGDKNATLKESLYRNRHGKPMDSYGSSRKKHSTNVIAGSRNLSPPNSGILDGSSKRKVLDCHVDDHVRTQKRATPPWTQLHQSSVHNKVSETGCKSKYAEAGTNQEAIGGVVSLSTNEIKKHKTDEVGDSYRRKDAPVIASIDGSHRRRVSSSDENSSYIKYEKKEPELKGPIKDVSQYRAYVKEYQEKYESYCSLNKILESYRDEFSNLGKDLKNYIGRDMKKYHDIMGQIKSSFCQRGEKHKRLKKIFVVLYEELKHLKQMIKHYAASHTKD